MADLPANEDDLQQDQAALRRQARRRLVGAVALALSAILLVPMLFDSDPRPLGSDVDVRIPSPETPFLPAPAHDSTLPADAQPAPATDGVTPLPRSEVTEPAVVPSVAEATDTHQVALPQKGPVMKPTVPSVDHQSSENVVEKVAASQVARQATKPATKPAPKTIEPVTEKPALRAQEKAQEKKQEKTRSAADEASASEHRYFIQMGVFGSEGNAKTLLDRIKAAGFKASLLNAAGQYRVRVGPFADRDKAAETANKLKAKGFSAVIIAS